MALSNTLNTNEVKNASGTEVEFTRISTEARETVFAQVGEVPSLPHRLSVKHMETGSGMKKRRRSAIRVDKTVISGVDASTSVTPFAVLYIDAPVGALASSTEMANVLAEVLSFAATLGTNTHLYDGTGTGSAALLAGSV